MKNQKSAFGNMLGKFTHDGFVFRVYETGMVCFGSVTCQAECLVGQAKKKAAEILSA